MKSIPLKKTLPAEKTFTDEKKSPSKKKFPKISEIDPDERKKKKQSEESFAVPCLQPIIPKTDILPLERLRAVIQTLNELKTPIIQQITLQKENGITKTEFIIQTKAFNEVEIHLTMYDTDPYSFHVKLLGDEKIRDLSAKHQDILIAQIKESKSKITVHIGTPLLRKKDRFVTKKKKSVVQSKDNCYLAVKEG